jgi:hypothetical protein
MKKEGGRRKEEGRRRKEEEGRKKKDGRRRKKEEGRRRKEEGGRKKEEGRGVLCPQRDLMHGDSGSRSYDGKIIKWRSNDDVTIDVTGPL